MRVSPSHVAGVLALMTALALPGPQAASQGQQGACRPPQAPGELGVSDPRGFVFGSRYDTRQDSSGVPVFVFEYRICNQSGQPATVTWDSARLRLPLVASSAHDEVERVTVPKWLLPGPVAFNSSATIQTPTGVFTLSKVPAYQPFLDTVVLRLTTRELSQITGTAAGIVTSVGRSPQAEIRAVSTIRRLSPDTFEYGYSVTKSPDRPLFAEWLSVASQQRPSGDALSLLAGDTGTARTLVGGGPVVINDVLLLGGGSGENLPGVAGYPVLRDSWTVAGTIGTRFADITTILLTFPHAAALIAPAFVPANARSIKP
jgi:hypothetical protein